MRKNSSVYFELLSINSLLSSKAAETLKKSREVSTEEIGKKDVTKMMGPVPIGLLSLPALNFREFNSYFP